MEPELAEPEPEDAELEDAEPEPEAPPEPLGAEPEGAAARGGAWSFEPRAVQRWLGTAPMCPKLERVRARTAERQRFKVFLSSPFDGLEGERATIMDRHMDVLARLCEGAGWVLGITDMRLGITRAMGNDGLTVTTCLRGVEHADAAISATAMPWMCGAAREVAAFTLASVAASARCSGNATSPGFDFF